MNLCKSWKALAVLSALALVAMTSNRAYAYSSTATLNIDVAITASLSVQIDGGISSTRTYSWNTTAPDFANSDSSVTVRNDSSGLNEKWSLSTFAKSIDTTDGSAPWDLLVTTDPVDVHAAGHDHFAVLAMFSSSATVEGGCPAIADVQWFGTTTTVSVSPQTYGTAEADGNWYTRIAHSPTNMGIPAGPDGGAELYLSPYNADTHDPRGHRGQRALCWKVIGPAAVSKANSQEIQLLITAAP